MSHLFLVEDDTILGESVQDFFTEFDYQVTWAQHGDTAQEMLTAHAFDLLILDFNLPKRSGLQLIQFVRGNHDNTPIIMITANSNEDDIRQCHEAGINALFGKPFELDALLKCVEALLLATVR